MRLPGSLRRSDPCARWSNKRNATEEEVLAALQEEVNGGNINLLVVAKSAELAHEWQGRVLEDLRSWRTKPEGVGVFASPVLTAPPAKLVDCLDEYFQKELLKRIWGSVIPLANR